jgi:hypothetical protein
MRILFVVAAFLVFGFPAVADEITADNWTETVSFKPNVPEGLPKSIKKKNIDKAGDLIPAGMKLLIEKYGLKLKTTGYQPVHPSEGYIEATNRFRGKPKIIDVGDAINKRAIKDYTAGLPFPGPRTGLEVAWNFLYAYGGDDAQITYSVHWISGSAGLEHSEEWRLSTIRGINRTDIDPKPAIESFLKKGLQGAGMTYALAPYDKKGFGAVYHRSIEPRDSIGHTYVPSMRRILKNTFGTRGDTWNATDLLFEDVRGYSGYPEWMHWKLLEKKTVLLPMHSGVMLGKKYQYEPRPVYVLEVTPKLPDYPYSRQLLYVDAEAFQILYKESYDKKGELWKIMLNSASYHPNEEGDEILGWSGTVVIDIQAEHATIFHVHQARGNTGLDPDMFTVSNLRKRSK